MHNGALEMAPVRVNAVSPGLVATPMWAGMEEADRERMLSSAADRLPLRGIGEAFNIANAVLFLACSLFSTGSTVVVDGGATIAA
jgi:NAD(P)-dependent dehydrogenase (short-subunit alcohol dehydrogenase family)